MTDLPSAAKALSAETMENLRTAHRFHEEERAGAARAIRQSGNPTRASNTHQGVKERFHRKLAEAVQAAIFALSQPPALPGREEIAPLVSIAISLKRIADSLADGRIAGIDFETAAERAGQAFSVGMRALADPGTVTAMAEAFHAEEHRLFEDETHDGSNTTELCLLAALNHILEIAGREGT